MVFLPPITRSMREKYKLAEIQPTNVPLIETTIFELG